MDIRRERDIAAVYTARVVAEFEARGLIPSSPRLDGRADHFRAELLGDSTDLIAGVQTVSELDDGALRRIGSFASAREGYCAYLVELLNSGEPFAFSAWAR